tara:strand:- start:1417 stop:2265 length:849 start_codon:yes stop_codon:yes gene_type:complete
MPNSYKEYTQGLTGNSFTGFDIKFISEGHLKVLTSTDDGSTFSTTSLTVAVSSNTATLSGAPSTGSDGINKIRIYRSTGTDQLIDFQNGSRLSETDLDTAYQQGLFVSQEVFENGSNSILAKGEKGDDGTNGADGDSPFKDNFAHLTEVTGGSIAAAQGDNTRNINTEAVTQSWVSVGSGGQFTLDAGTYHIEASAPSVSTDRHYIRLNNTADSSVVVTGQTAFSGADNVATHAHLVGRFTISGSSTFTLVHNCGAARTGDGLGVGIGNNTYHSQIRLIKLS